jgi:hypothetical protein
MQGSAVRVPVRPGDAPAVQPHDAPTGSVMALAQVKTPRRCAYSA